jgi:hypothetical protein
MARTTDDSWLWLAYGGALAAGLYLWVGRDAAARLFSAAGGVAMRKRVTTEGERVRLALLEPEVQTRLRQLEARMLTAGIRLYWGSGVRTKAQQEALLAKGKTTTVNSWHRARRAMDVYPIDESTQKPDTNARNEAAFRLLHREWFKLGGRGLAYKPYPDGPKNIIKGMGWDAGHLEYHGPYPTAVAAIQATERKAVA